MLSETEGCLPLERERNTIVKEGNTIVKEGNTFVKEGNTIVKEGNAIVKEGNAIVKEGNTIVNTTVKITGFSPSCLVPRVRTETLWRDSALVGKTETLVGKTETLVGKTETLCDIAQFGVVEHYLVLGLLPRLSRPMSVWPFRRLREKISYRRSCETEGIVCKGDCVEKGTVGKGDCVYV